MSCANYVWSGSANFVIVFLFRICYVFEDAEIRLLQPEEQFLEVLEVITQDKSRYVYVSIQL